MLNVTRNYTTIGASVKNGIHQLTTKFMVGEILWYTISMYTVYMD
jgi:hypothetical protein